MRSGQITSRFNLTIPTVYIDPAICITKDGDVEKEILRAITDLWKNYDVNIRYLHVIKKEEEADRVEQYISKLPLKFACTIIFDFHMLSYLQADNVACFFGFRNQVPTNYKVYDKYQLANEYSTILSAQRRTGTKSHSRYVRRRDA